MKFLVTGGAGFLGSHLCDFLLNKNHYVICMDNLITGNKDNIKHLLNNKDFEFINHDITKFIEIKEKIDYIMHFASPASPIDYQKIPIPTLKAGSLGTHNLLGLALVKKAKFLLASTSEVYGDPLVNPQPESYWGNVNPVGPRGCFSHDTEILTSDGWKNFKDLSKNEVVATLNAKTFGLEYKKVKEVIKYHHNGCMYYFKNSKIDLIVTPNHKMYVKRKHRNYFGLLKAEERIQWNGAQAKTDCIWKGKEKKYFYLPKLNNPRIKNIEKIKMDVWLEFFGYYISEGCIHLRKRTQTINSKIYKNTIYNILIAQDKRRKRNRVKITKCLQKMPFNFFSSDDHQFRIVSKQLGTYLKNFGKAKDKYIPQEIKSLSERKLRILFEALMFGDGNKKKTKYYTKSKKLADDVQEIALKIGLSGQVTKVKNRNIYVVNIRYSGKSKLKKDFLTPKYPSPNKVKYNDYVYCVEVPNHIIYVRRNGKALWCGNCYDESKRFAEALTMAYHRIHQIDTKIVRIFNTYGERMRPDDGRVVPTFINQAIKNESLTIFGNGSQTRSFCYVSDLIEGIYKLAMSDINEPINIGNPEEMTILDFAKKVVEITETKSKIVFKDLPVDDPKTRRPDITKAKELLGWQPKVSLDEGLGRTIRYFREEIK